MAITPETTAKQPMTPHFIPLDYEQQEREKDARRKRCIQYACIPFFLVAIGACINRQIDVREHIIRSNKSEEKAAKDSYKPGIVAYPPQLQTVPEIDFAQSLVSGAVATVVFWIILNVIRKLSK